MSSPNPLPPVEEKRQALLPEDPAALPPPPNNNREYRFGHSLDAPQPSQTSSYDMSVSNAPLSFTPHEVLQLRKLLNSNPTTTTTNPIASNYSMDSSGANSEYSEFPETTHAWAVFAGKPQRKATKIDRIVGTSIIFFQLFTYSLFVAEAIEDYQRGIVPVFISHDHCEAAGEEPEYNFQCEADYTSHWDAVVAFFMLSVFLTPEILQALRAIRSAYQDDLIGTPTLIFACLAAVEVIGAFLAAAIAISYQLFIGEVTDAIEVGVGLLFVRELSARAYRGIRHKGVKQYKSFSVMLVILIVGGFLIEAFCESYARRVLAEQSNW